MATVQLKSDFIFRSFEALPSDRRGNCCQKQG
ncbi:hypothetical protein OIU76_006259 [Salix suchowensis]|nr:hypothetical protein OIU78_016146 [Salix suchowensis]KAJ6344696.1 hypothetical protein OIU76_006259 [Salix suchowensis]